MLVFLIGVLCGVSAFSLLRLLSAGSRQEQAKIDRLYTHDVCVKEIEDNLQLLRKIRDLDDYIKRLEALKEKTYWENKNLHNKVIALEDDINFKDNGIDVFKRCLDEKYLMIADLKDKLKENNIKINNLRNYYREYISLTTTVEEKNMIINDLTESLAREMKAVDRRDKQYLDMSIQINDLTEQLHGCEGYDKVYEENAEIAVNWTMTGGEITKNIGGSVNIAAGSVEETTLLDTMREIARIRELQVRKLSK